MIAQLVTSIEFNSMSMEVKTDKIDIEHKYITFKNKAEGNKFIAVLYDAVKISEDDETATYQIYEDSKINIGVL